MGRYELICYFLIILIVGIPINSSITLAKIQSVEVSGKDGIDGFRDSTDNIDFTVILDADASPDNLKTDFPASRNFEECTGSECTLSFLENDMTPSAYPFTISEIRGAMIVDTYNGVLTVDGLAPIIRNLNLAVDNENLTFNYDVDDVACDTCSACVGLNGLSLKENGVLIWSAEKSSCSAMGVDKISLNELGTVEGDTEICLEAEDKFHHKSTLCKTVFVDTQAPIIFEDSFEILDENGFPLTHIIGIVKAKAVINISDEDLDSVSGDFSAFNNLKPENYKDVDAKCKIKDEFASCVFDLVVEGIDGEVTATINAIDKKGNQVQTDVSTKIIKSNQVPEILDVYVIKEFKNSTLYVSSGSNRIYVVLKDNAPYNKGDVKIDFGSGETKASDCKKSDDWICTFDVNVRGTHGQRRSYEIVARSDPGNYNRIRKDAEFDNNPPKIEEVVLSSDCATANEGLDIEVFYVDSNDVKIYLDVSRISNNPRPIEAACEGDSCFIFVNDLFTSYTKDLVVINITDVAGNSIIKEQLVEICEADNSIEPNLITVVAGTGQPLDKRLLSFLGGSAYVPVSFRKGGAKIISIDTICPNVGSSRILNKNGLTSTLVLDINQVSLDEDEFKTNCTFSLVVRKGTRVFSTPEIEIEEITVPLFNNALGEMGESMQAKIDAMTEEINSVQDEIEKWEQWNKWLGMLCSIAETMGKINSLINSIKSVIWGVSCAMTNYPPTKAAGEGLWGTVCRFTTKFSYYVESFFWPTGLIGPNPVGMFVKYGCMVYTCRMCDWSQFISIGTSAAAGALLPTSMEYTDSMFSGTGQSMTSEYSISGRGDFRDNWKAAAETTKPPLTDETQWIYDPYKSIHYAKACLCLPGYIYNLKKDRQIKCMYKTCLQESAKVGLPTDSCDVALRERECLYVDSAQYKKHGYLEGFLDNLWPALIKMLPGIVIGIAYSASCPEAKIDATGATCLPGNTCGNFRPVFCGLAGAAAAITELMDIFNGGLDFSKYDQTLEGTDFCGGTE